MTTNFNAAMIGRLFAAAQDLERQPATPVQEVYRSETYGCGGGRYADKWRTIGVEFGQRIGPEGISIFDLDKTGLAPADYFAFCLYDLYNEIDEQGGCNLDIPEWLERLREMKDYARVVLQIDTAYLDDVLLYATAYSEQMEKCLVDAMFRCLWVQNDRLEKFVDDVLERV